MTASDPATPASHASGKTSPALEQLLSRASRDDLVAPAPEGQSLETILAAALRAPDHGRLRPWRYVAITGEARPAFAHEVLAAIDRQEPELPEKKREMRFARFSTTPLVLALGMHLQPESPIPVWEQEMAVGAAAMNVLNALHLAGFGGKWISGKFCDDPKLRESLGLKGDDRLAGFMFIGTPAGPRPVPGRPDPKAYLAFWKPGSKVSFPVDRESAQPG
ncbi:nitroreductase [Oecophyllibacter saccharovorans]|uniref:nitroreductase family protein n=1 Tax=Oecophyllibacter saccharovorans TaxID=2558360 RepID=UPI001141ED08|nr:nitroreductase [Oecophyllibacter saccharovorans]QDH14885.1 nitroreductase [Oecophyllibacter saccharovorans]